MKDFAALLEQRRRASLYRRRRIIESPQGADVVLDGRKLISFCSNDYLGLANHPDLKQAAKKAIDDFGVGSGAAHLISGHSRLHHQLEEALAERTGRQRALLFSTGYMANLGVITALTGRHDAVFQDKLNHASLIDAGKASDATVRRYAHADVSALSAQLQQSDAKAKLVVTDAVFSMDGDIAPLTNIAKTCEQHAAYLMVDDAHGFGVLGERGAGCIEAAQLSAKQVPVLMATLGKALGCFGAFVAGDEDLIEFLIQEARSYVYTTASPPAMAAAALAALHLLDEEAWRREKLSQLLTQFKTGAAELGLTLMPSDTPIQPLLVGDESKAIRMSEKLMAAGFWVTAIRPPTVPAGTARLRITLSAAHEPTHIEQLLAALAEAVKA